MPLSPITAPGGFGRVHRRLRPAVTVRGERQLLLPAGSRRSRRRPGTRMRDHAGSVPATGGPIWTRTRSRNSALARRAAGSAGNAATPPAPSCRPHRRTGGALSLGGSEAVRTSVAPVRPLARVVDGASRHRPTRAPTPPVAAALSVGWAPVHATSSLESAVPASRTARTSGELRPDRSPAPTQRRRPSGRPEGCPGSQAVPMAGRRSRDPDVQPGTKSGSASSPRSPASSLQPGLDRARRTNPVGPPPRPTPLRLRAAGEAAARRSP